MQQQQFEVWKDNVMPALQSKLEELHMFGYNKATIDTIWKSVMFKLRKRKDYIHLHEFVNVILTLRAPEYMNYLTVENYNAADWFANEGVIEELVGDDS
ncbi:post-transcriptional regulator [Alkalihalobacterium elongatum]|uniref:post-transcriptional regulator n=1 Tax=Alkalihalobacterium elongatum TaxID=2675466 RepID=UPI001C1F8C0E|nr:post-transcriptional regulator [Alkalihalobacterium elongatum]